VAPVTNPAARAAEVADVVRAYLAEGFGVPALERTTEEVLEQSGGADPAPPEPERLAGVLSVADLAKFASGALDEGALARQHADAVAYVEAARRAEIVFAAKAPEVAR
jgi:hypothetical protein